MGELKTFLLCLFGLTSLVVATWLFTDQSNSAEYGPLPAGPALSTLKPQSTGNPSEAGQGGCMVTSQRMALPQAITFDDMPDISFTTTVIPPDLRHHSLISGPIDNADCLAKSWPQNCEFVVRSPALVITSGAVYGSNCTPPLLSEQKGCAPTSAVDQECRGELGISPAVPRSNDLRWNEALNALRSREKRYPDVERPLRVPT